MKKRFNKEVEIALSSPGNRNPGLVTEDDLRPLPFIVQKYLRNSGVLGQEKTLNIRVEMTGKMRGKEGDSWMKIRSVQYNFFENPTRIFYIKAMKMGIPAVGLHLYKNETAIMVIKLAGLFTVADARGPEMDQGETVTVFNDMCFMAQGTLISKDIKWEIIDPYTVKAVFTNGRITISAILYFDEDGNIKDFISNDRFETADGKIFKNYPWSTPVTDYKTINGKKLPLVAKAIYQHPEGEFCYAEFVIRKIECNVREM